MVAKEASIPTLQNFTCATPPGSNQPLLCRSCRQATCKETGVFSHDAIAHSGCAGSVFRRRASLKTSKFPGGREREGKEKGYSQHCVSFSTRLAINAWAVPRATYTRIHVAAASLKVLLIAASRIGPGKSRRMSNHTELWVMCGRRRLGKNFLSCCSIGRVRSCVRPVCAAVKPLAIMLCADRVPIVSTHFKVR